MRKKVVRESFRKWCYWKGTQRQKQRPGPILANTVKRKPRHKKGYFVIYLFKVYCKGFASVYRLHLSVMYHCRKYHYTLHKPMQVSVWWDFPFLLSLKAPQAHAEMHACMCWATQTHSRTHRHALTHRHTRARTHIYTHSHKHTGTWRNTHPLSSISTVKEPGRSSVTSQIHLIFAAHRWHCAFKEA